MTTVDYSDDLTIARLARAVESDNMMLEQIPQERRGLVVSRMNRYAQQRIAFERNEALRIRRATCDHKKTRWTKTADDREADRYIGGINETEVCVNCGAHVITARESMRRSDHADR